LWPGRRCHGIETILIGEAQSREEDSINGKWLLLSTNITTIQGKLSFKVCVFRVLSVFSNWSKKNTEKTPEKYGKVVLAEKFPSGGCVGILNIMVSTLLAMDPLRA
jgi:hypothetical protein